MAHRLLFRSLAVLAGLPVLNCPPPAVGQSPGERIAGRGAPSVFQAWNPIDHAEWPVDTDAGRLAAAAKHDVLWEEPVSQLGYGVKLVLGAEWQGQHGGLAVDFTPESKSRALANRAAMLKLNPHMVFLLEVRWRDAPGSFLPEESPFWRRTPEGERVLGWDNGPEPYYLLNSEHEGLIANIARQTKIAVDSGIYDGVMLDWDGSLPVVTKVREALGESGLIVVNIHDRIELGRQYGQLINGAFMELSPAGPGAPSQKLGTWESAREALVEFEQIFRAPRVNCLEAWGDRNDLRRMRAVTTLGLTHSAGSVLYADPNPLSTPDHLHDWYAMWDVELGVPQSAVAQRADGAYERVFEHGVVIYNPWKNGGVTVNFTQPHKSVATGSVANSFMVEDADGDVFLPESDPN